MPTLSMFYGIIISMFSEPNTPHHCPHLHAEYQDFQAVYDFNGNILEGQMDNKKDKLIRAWIEIHQEDLSTDWKLLQNGQGYFKINPLQ